MSGYCLDCGNTLCLCKDLEKQQLKDAADKVLNDHAVLFLKLRVSELEEELEDLEKHYGIVLELYNENREARELEEQLAAEKNRADKLQHQINQMIQEIKKVLPRAPKMDGRESFSHEQYLVARIIDKYEIVE